MFSLSVLTFPPFSYYCLWAVQHHSSSVWGKARSYYSLGRICFPGCSESTAVLDFRFVILSFRVQGLFRVSLITKLRFQLELMLHHEEMSCWQLSVLKDYGIAKRCTHWLISSSFAPLYNTSRLQHTWSTLPQNYTYHGSLLMMVFPYFKAISHKTGTKLSSRGLLD